MKLDEEFEIIKQFAKENKNLFLDGKQVLSHRSKKIEYLSNEHLDQIKENFIKSRTFKNKEVSTVPDDAVYICIKKKFNKTDEEIKLIKESHNMGMSVEGLIGHTLEEYIYSETKSENWIWCSGSILRSIDFIKKETVGENTIWKMLQVKNSDNSENSSSKKVREGTPIKHWFRRFSKRKAHNWEKLNELMNNENLSEDNFLNYLKNNI
jgi:hypothetical protein